MKKRTLTLISASPQATSPKLVDAVCQLWPSRRPQIRANTMDQVLADESFLDDCGLAWIFVTDGPADRLYELIGLLQDRHLPAMLTREGESEPVAERFQDGVMIGPPDAPPIALFAVLRTLWGQATMVKALQSEVSILRAHQGGLCDQIDKIDEELRLAAQLQREFLPAETPSVENLDVQVLYRPASYVSGDIYDITRLDETHVGVFVADAVGHGVPAALMTMYIKRSLRMKRIDADAERGYQLIPPDEALKQLNEEILDHHNGGRIRTATATAVYGVLNIKTLQMSIARAGHPYPMVLSSDGPVKLLKPQGAMLGVFPDEHFELTTIQLHAGDRVLFYTDGFEVAFPDAGDEGGSFNGNPYVHIFKDMGQGTPPEAMRRLTSRLDRQVGSLNQSDDLTALLVDVCEPAGDNEDGGDTKAFAEPAASTVS